MKPMNSALRFTLRVLMLPLGLLWAATAEAQHHGHHGVQRDAAAHDVMMQHAAGGGPDAAGEAAPSKPIPEPQEFVTTHSIKVGGRTLRYQAIAEETYLRGPDGSPKASIFSMSYIKEELIGDSSKRPITFVFNGGPGSSSVWLHLGAFGPKRLDLGDDPLSAGAPPYAMSDNAHTLLTHTDLVFIDPVGTGYSRPLGSTAANAYFGVDEDAASIAEFIRTYLRKHQRWGSPRYLAGESYGATRAALLIRDLSLKSLSGIAFNGVILVSPSLDTRLLRGGGAGGEVTYVTQLPTLAATAYYHDRLPEKPADLERFLEEVWSFASTAYLTALFQGDALPEERAQAIAERLHRYTGLSEAYLKRSNLRVSNLRFLKELLRDRGETLAIHDTRFRGEDPDDAGEMVMWDPFGSAMDAPFVSAINGYVGGDLGVDFDRDYEVFSMPAIMMWKRAKHLQRAQSGYLNVAPFLAEAAATNDDFRVFVAGGYHDLVTTVYGMEYTMAQSGIDPERITQRNYFGGHMMYLHEPSLKKLSADIRRFFAGT